uniref:F-box domain-containing protein n=1 Tax=Leptocylindrus danicus TaxID=163516 RepID=A0A7S2K1R0_9STRA|mmetsp:Transcript_16127/g.23747  ORF Transcript_16127/g.23747 Transcript_16127/m.23747 type:complete len:331 (+) Transcript_16127:153-1145(+)
MRNEYDLPDEVLRQIHDFCDIPSLAALICTSKKTLGCKLASDETTWSKLTSLRFGIRINKNTRPTAYGAPTWHAVFRRQAVCNRPPKSRYMQKSKLRVVDNFCSILGVGLWATIRHRDDCKTRLERHLLQEVPSCDGGGASGNIGRPIRRPMPIRFIELNICLQLQASYSRPIVVDFLNTELDMFRDGCNIGKVGVRSAKILHHCQWTSTTTSRSIRHSRGYSKLEAQDRESNFEVKNDDVSSCAILRPYEYVIASIHVPCMPDVVFETDFLSRALRMHVPFRFINDNKHESISSDFLSEEDIWMHYMELPGGCLALTDRPVQSRELRYS